MQIGLLGSFDLRADDGAAVDVPGSRLRGLVAALALQPGRVLSKSALIDWIWGDNPPADATNALQRLASRLRKVLPADVIEGQTGGYRLAVGADDVDAVRFERLLTQARQQQGPRQVQLLRDAVELWRGPAMQDIGLTDSETFDAAVTRLEGLRLAAAEERLVAEVGVGRGPAVVGELSDAVAAHPLRERLVAAMMRALVADGRDAEALLAYERTKEKLADELGTDPTPELSALHVAILRGQVGRREENRKTNVRAELTSFVGREDDLIAVRDLIGRHRLTTLIGPGGGGKTRLATETARAMGDDFPDGVWVVELAAVSADSDIALSIQTALGLRDALLGSAPSADPMDGLIAALRDRETLLIMDNCEHLIEAAARVAERLLGECRRLRILATSREPLGITGEALWQVEPLTVPADGDPSAIAGSPAVRLFRDRAGAVRRDLGDDEAALASMIRICRALDGMPLAIELAAARLRTMTLDQLAGRLDDRFRLLTSGSRTALPRHKTLRAVVDWSWELLTDAERAALRRLAVFSAGASLEAAEKVCADPSTGAQLVHPDDVLELLSSLADKSLLVAAGDGVPRYRMISTIKEYAADRLAESGETEPAQQAHLACFTELAETAEPQLRRADQVQWLARLATEHDNLTTAMRRAIGSGDAEAAMRLAGAAGWYWWLAGHRAEGIELLTAAAGLPGEVSDEIRAMTHLLVVLYVTSGRGDEQLGADWIHTAYRLGQRSVEHNPLLDLAIPLERMLQAPEEALPAFEALLTSVDPWVRAVSRWQVGKMRTILGQGGREAEAAVEQALAEFRSLGERFGISLALAELATQRGARGEFAIACSNYEEAVAAVTEIGAIEDVIELRTQQAQLHWLNGDPDSSAAAIAEAERCAEVVTWPYALVQLALAKAKLARWRGDTALAHEQLGIATTLLDTGPEQASVRAEIHDELGYLATDFRASRIHRVAAWQAASEAPYPYLIARTLVGVADLAIRLDQYEQAARLLAASVAVSGLPNRSDPDVARIEQLVRGHLGEERFAEVTGEGSRASWSELAEVTLAS